MVRLKVVFLCKFLYLHSTMVRLTLSYALSDFCQFGPPTRSSVSKLFLLAYFTEVSVSAPRIFSFQNERNYPTRASLQRLNSARYPQSPQTVEHLSYKHCEAFNYDAYLSVAYFF